MLVCQRCRIIITVVVVDVDDVVVVVSPWLVHIVVDCRCHWLRINRTSKPEVEAGEQSISGPQNNCSTSAGDGDGGCYGGSGGGD